MPAKGRSRAHQTIQVAPPRHDSSTVAGVAGIADGQGGAPWDETRFEPEPTDDPVPDSLRAPAVRRYRGEGGTQVVLPNVTGLRHVARQQTGEPLDVTTAVQVADAEGDTSTVSGPAQVTAQGGLRYGVDGDALRCAVHGETGCEHRERATDAVQAVIEARRIRSALTEWENASARVAEYLAEDHDRSEQARLQTPDRAQDRPWSADSEAFQAAYQAALDRSAAGEAPVPYMTENATGGLAARDGGRGFGVELEFDFAPGVDRSAALAAIGRDLHNAGLTSSPYQQHYHAGRTSPNWRFETDATVSGEVVSPVLYDEPATWSQLRQVCDILRRHGARATPRTGGHVHVGVGDFDHTIENHNNLLGLYGAHEDVLYRLAQNPAAQAHRGRYWCTPNRIPAAGYQTIGDVRRHNPHASAVNFQAVSGNSADHVEFRMWDGSLDPGVIQAQVNLSLGMTDAAFRAERGSTWGREPIGHHRHTNRGRHVAGRLEGDNWLHNTASFRRLVDRIFSRDTNREQAAALFAVTRWQRP